MPELSVIVPTYNEQSNVEPMIGVLARALSGVDYEIVFVDDASPDGTAACVRHIAQLNARVRIVHRIGRRGLSSAVIEGMLTSSAPYLAVIDADLQHDESILPRMLAELKAGALDIVIGTRHLPGGGMGTFSRRRVMLSNAGKWLSRTICGIELSDPMSGFFVLDRRFLDEVVYRLSGVGFKILVDLLASATRPVRFAEVGYVFRDRRSGESKLDLVVGAEYLTLLVDKLTAGWVPVNYVLFLLVGTVGLGASLILVAVLERLTGWPFQTVQVVASSVVIALNFFLNNALTFRQYRFPGHRMLGGLALYSCACLIGLGANVWVAGKLQLAGVVWIVSACVGLMVGSVWNYLISTLFVWRITRAGREVCNALPKTRQPGTPPLSSVSPPAMPRREATPSSLSDL